MNTATTENFGLDNFTAVDFLASEGRTILINDVALYELEAKNYHQISSSRASAFSGGKIHRIFGNEPDERANFRAEKFSRLAKGTKTKCLKNDWRKLYWSV